MAEINSLPALGAFERIGFIVLGGIFLWVSFLLATDDSWAFPLFILPIAGYVAIRGIIGHELKIREKDSRDLATPEGLVLSAQSELTSTGRKLLALDICLAILLLIIELVFAILGSIAASLS
ncbi:hypothetical protein VDG1235_1143 [Verrucomicrobiia bacterium DG1235]|nr:hypothetical protein VDG1235_1143 [Verrucomicrobiae bacterium DG1235]